LERMRKLGAAERKGGVGQIFDDLPNEQ